MKHKIKIFIGPNVSDSTSQIEKFCESVGFDNVISINHSNIEDDVTSVMVHYKSEN